MARPRPVVLLFLVGILALPVIAGFFLLPRGLFRPYNLPAPPPRAPLASIAVHQVQWKDDCKGVEATLQQGALLCDVVNCDVIEGFGPAMSLEAARKRHGAPSGEWTDPLYGVPAYYYDVPLGRISLCLAPDSGSGHWVTVGYPKSSACRDVVRHPELLAQVLEIRGDDDEIYFSLRSADPERSEITLHAKGARCDSLEFSGTESMFRGQRGSGLPIGKGTNQ